MPYGRSWCRTGYNHISGLFCEYGKTEVDVDASSVLFDGVSDKTICWMSHTDYIAEAPADFKGAAKAAMRELLDGAKLPKMDTLKKQHRELSEKKKALYAEYRKAQEMCIRDRSMNTSTAIRHDTFLSKFTSISNPSRRWNRSRADLSTLGRF